MRKAIVSIANQLVDYPERYKRDSNKKNNPDNYRVFETHSYRITYKHTEKEILILRIRHVKQKPSQY